MRNAFFGLLLSCTTAVAAGPSPHWTYTAVLLGENGSQYVGTGFGMRPDDNQPDGVRRYTGYTMLTNAPNLGAQTGSARIPIGGPGRSEYFWDAEKINGAPPLPGGQLDTYYGIDLTITDTVTGISNHAYLRTYASSNDSWLGLPIDMDLPLTGTGSGDATQREFDIAGFHYFLTFSQERTNSRPDPVYGSTWDSTIIHVDVSVSALPLPTPEPATLALAGVGLAGIALRRKLTPFLRSKQDQENNHA